MKSYYEQDGITIYHGDALDILPLLPQVDHIITDPPYSPLVHENNRAYMSHSGEVRQRELGFDGMIRHQMDRFMAQFVSVVKRWSLVFSDVEHCHDWREAAEGVGLRYIRTAAWIRKGAPQFSGDRPAIGFEVFTVLHAPQGKLRWHGGGTDGVYYHPNVTRGAEERMHTTQKPIGLMRELIRLFTNPGDLVLDPFMGSGTTLRAAKDLGRRAIGIEIEERYCEIAALRLSQGVLPFERRTESVRAL